MTIHIKGMTIKSRLEFARKRGGDPLMEKLRSAPAPVGELANSTMLALREFPLAHDDQLCRFIATQLRAGETIFQEMGAFNADEHRSMQKIVHGVKTDPAALLAGMPRQFPQYLKGGIGTARFEPVGSLGGRILWEGHDETYPSHCLSNIGYVVRLLENSGVTGASGRNAECKAGGGARCVWEFSWTGKTGLRRATESFRAISS